MTDDKTRELPLRRTVVAFPTAESKVKVACITALREVKDGSGGGVAYDWARYVRPWVMGLIASADAAACLGVELDVCIVQNGDAIERTKSQLYRLKDELAKTPNVGLIHIDASGALHGWRRGTLLNYGAMVSDMDGGADWTAFLDLDMVMVPSWLEKLVMMSEKEKDLDVVWLGGLKLQRAESERLEMLFDGGKEHLQTAIGSMQRLPIDPDSAFVNCLMKKYFGALVMNQKALGLVRATTNSGWLYEWDFAAWGGEDIALRVAVDTLQAARLIGQTLYSPNTWRHLWHPNHESKKGLAGEPDPDYDQNRALLDDMREHYALSVVEICQELGIAG